MAAVTSSGGRFSKNGSGTAENCDLKKMIEYNSFSTDYEIIL